MLQVIGSLNIGGAEKVLSELATSLDPQVFDVSVCCTKAAGPIAEALRSKGVSVELALPSRTLRHATTLGLARHVARIKPDVVHTHGSTALVHAGPLGGLSCLPPWVHTFHYGNYPKAVSFQASLERWFSRFPRQLVAVSVSQRQSLINALGVDPSRTMTILNGVRSNQHADDSAMRTRGRHELGFSLDEFVVGSVAVLSEQKGVSYLLKAAAQVLAQSAEHQVCDCRGRSSRTAPA